MGRKKLSSEQQLLSRERRKAKECERYLRTKEGRELERDMVGDNSVTYCLENGFTLANPACPGEVNLT